MRSYLKLYVFNIIFMSLNWVMIKLVIDVSPIRQADVILVCNGFCS